MQTETTTKPVENLSPDFWYGMRKQFPDAMVIFGEWVDEYKERNNWNVLFSGDFKMTKNSSGSYDLGKKITPKYHELPFAMQIGIWMEFVFDQGIYWVFDFSTDLKTDIRDFLAVLEVK